jgi:hypothetical protein
MKFSMVFLVMILAAGSSASLAEVGRQVAPGVREVRLEFPDKMVKILPASPQAPVSGYQDNSLLSKSVNVSKDEEWVTLLAEDFEAGFPGNTWTLYYEGDGPYWDDWTCSYGDSPPHSAGCAAGGEGAISCDDYYPNFMNTFMTAGPFSLPQDNLTAGILECVLNLDCEMEVDDFFMLVSLDGVTEWNGFQYSGVFSHRTIDLDLSNVPFLGNVLDEPQLWVSFGFRSNESVVKENGAQIDDVLLAVEIDGVPDIIPSLQISALKNPGRPRTLHILVLVTNGSGSVPQVVAGRANLVMSYLGEGVYSGTYFASLGTESVTITASDTNSAGTGTAQASVGIP